ncbi:MAG TPA: hypothetical protein VJ438_03795 [Candidatus Nanoarchaeia archaeon]|nr:hypothetical protein [Candidatus Nanoarchaeia archaeon]
MRIGIIGPSKIEYVEEVNPDAKKILKEIVKKVINREIVVVPDKGSVSEFFAKEYIKSKGKKVWNMLPLEDKEFGLDYVNTEIGEKISCGTWRNQPEKLNEETDVLLCVGYAVGVLAEIAYSKWFKPKPVYILKELISGELPKEINKSLDLRYISYKDLNLK